MLYSKIADWVFLFQLRFVFLLLLLFAFFIIVIISVYILFYFFVIVFSRERERGVHLRSTFTIFFWLVLSFLALHFMRNAKISSQLKWRNVIWWSRAQGVCVYMIEREREKESLGCYFDLVLLLAFGLCIAVARLVWSSHTVNALFFFFCCLPVQCVLVCFFFSACLFVCFYFMCMCHFSMMRSIHRSKQPHTRTRTQTNKKKCWNGRKFSN